MIKVSYNKFPEGNLPDPPYIGILVQNKNFLIPNEIEGLLVVVTGPRIFSLDGLRHWDDSIAYRMIENNVQLYNDKVILQNK